MDWKLEPKFEHGTGLVEYLPTVTLADLERVFGPAMYNDGDKTFSEWRLRFADGTVATIYDYKAEGAFRVGGHSRRAYHRVAEALGIEIPRHGCGCEKGIPFPERCPHVEES